MSRIGFGGLVAAVMAVCFGVVWFVNRPPFEGVKPTLHTHFMSAEEVAAEARNRPTPGADTAPGWEKRKALRDHVLAAADQLEASPCDPATRKAFFDAYADQAMVMTDDSAESSDEKGPAFWRTADDDKVATRLEQLQKTRTVTFNEIADAVMDRKLGPNRPKMAVPSAAMNQDRCGPAGAVGRS